jgi:hypothetical protein
VRLLRVFALGVVEDDLRVVDGKFDAGHAGDMATEARVDEGRRLSPVRAAGLALWACSALASARVLGDQGRPRDAKRMADRDLIAATLAAGMLPTIDYRRSGTSGPDGVLRAEDEAAKDAVRLYRSVLAELAKPASGTSTP